MNFGAGYAVIRHCDSGSPVVESKCSDNACLNCSAVAHLRFGVDCQQFEWFDGGFMSLASIADSKGFVTYSNYLTATCEGPLLYAQPVPVGFCMNGTMVVVPN